MSRAKADGYIRKFKGEAIINPSYREGEMLDVIDTLRAKLAEVERELTKEKRAHKGALESCHIYIDKLQAEHSQYVIARDAASAWKCSTKMWRKVLLRIMCDYDGLTYSHAWQIVKQEFEETERT